MVVAARWVGVLSFMSACAHTGYVDWTVPATQPSANLQPSGHTRNVVVVTIDGVRWQEVFEGLDPTRAGDLPARDPVPNLRRFFTAGVVVGAPGHGDMMASGPSFVSLPGYREILTGRASTCGSNLCGQIRERTLLDELSAEGVGPLAVISSWGAIERAAAVDTRSLVISTGQRGGMTRERVRVSADASALLDRTSAAFPGWLDYRPDRQTAPLALAYLQAARPRFLFIGLGDTDEYAHRGDYAGYVASLTAADRFVGTLMATLATLGEYGADTTVIVTTDHGRAANFSGHGSSTPESGRVWMFVAGGAVAARGAIDTHDARLADIAPTVRAWMGLGKDRSPTAGQARLSPTLLAAGQP